MDTDLYVEEKKEKNSGILGGFDRQLPRLRAAKAIQG
jgi:hypothetical protein